MPSQPKDFCWQSGLPGTAPFTVTGVSTETFSSLFSARSCARMDLVTQEVRKKRGHCIWSHLRGFSDHEPIFYQLTDVLTRVGGRNFAYLYGKCQKRGEYYFLQIRGNVACWQLQRKPWRVRAKPRTSLGSIQILRAPQFNTEAASLFCNLRETMAWGAFIRCEGCV